MLLSPPRIKRSILLLAVAIMVGSVAAAELLKPRKYWANVIGEPHYAALVPPQFGDWQELPYAQKSVVNPVQEETLMRLYSETFARTYLHRPTGRRLMLSIAYGRDQSNDTQLHTPEACYPSQGFRIEERTEHTVKSRFGDIESVRLVTTLGPRRTEPLTFFVRVGDGVARGSRSRNEARVKMALQGYRVDGMLFRVSEVTWRQDPFELQDRFIQDLLNALDPQARRSLIGGKSTK
ncbi:exosortase C-terminal domain/associated protein EpsI [Aquabacterium sp.]|uniref:exosortase C-terminal domain/associated protein EpsI n=1 Tax=Aquabacterium sp. TaxID=1872578 RepID=UPI003D6D86F7